MGQQFENEEVGGLLGSLSVFTVVKLFFFYQLKIAYILSPFDHCSAHELFGVIFYIHIFFP